MCRDYTHLDIVIWNYCKWSEVKCILIISSADVFWNVKYQLQQDFFLLLATAAPLLKQRLHGWNTAGKCRFFRTPGLVILTFFRTFCKFMDFFTFFSGNMRIVTCFPRQRAPKSWTRTPLVLLVVPCGCYMLSFCLTVLLFAIRLGNPVCERPLNNKWNFAQCSSTWCCQFEGKCDKAALKFGSEAWVLKKREEQRLEAAQMNFLRHLLGITKLDKEKNHCIRQKTGAQNIVKEIKQYQKKWLQHVHRTDTNRLPKQALQFKPKGRRNIGRPRKRWRDQLQLQDQGTGNTPNPSGTWWWCDNIKI